MTKTVLSIEGMACGMCEAHVNDAIRANFSVKKVSSSHKKGQTEVISEASGGHWKDGLQPDRRLVGALREKASVPLLRNAGKGRQSGVLFHANYE